jgi:uncharacterized protein (DUF1330 family)
MAKGYAVVTELVRDPVGYRNYAEKAVRTIQQAGGRIMVVDDNPAVLEGRWHGSRTVILEFESVAAAHRWYESAEYQAVIGLRHAAAESNAVILLGFEAQRGESGALHAAHGGHDHRTQIQSCVDPESESPAEPNLRACWWTGVVRER